MKPPKISDFTKHVVMGLVKSFHPTPLPSTILSQSYRLHAEALCNDGLLSKSKSGFKLSTANAIDSLSHSLEARRIKLQISATNSARKRKNAKTN